MVVLGWAELGSWGLYGGSQGSAGGHKGQYISNKRDGGKTGERRGAMVV